MKNLTDGRRVYYVDKDYNNHNQYDFPYEYCVVSIDKTSWIDTPFVLAFAFDILTGQTKIYRYGGANDRVYSWTEVALGFPSFYKDYSTLASLANALGVKMSNTITSGGRYDSGIEVGAFGGITILGLYHGNTGDSDSTLTELFLFRGGYDLTANGSISIISRMYGGGGSVNDVTYEISNEKTIVFISPADNAQFYLLYF